MAVVVSDAGPLIALAKVDALFVARRLFAVEAAIEFLGRRATGTRPDELIRYLEDAPDTPPAPGDELPEA